MSDKFPGALAEIVEVTDFDTARAVALALGGIRIWVPLAKKLKPSSPLVKAVGMPKARIIAERLGWGHIEIPLGPFAGARRREAIDRAIKQGMKTWQVAQHFGICYRTAARYRARLRAEEAARKAAIAPQRQTSPQRAHLHVR